MQYIALQVTDGSKLLNGADASMTHMAQASSRGYLRIKEKDIPIRFKEQLQMLQILSARPKKKILKNINRAALGKYVNARVGQCKELAYSMSMLIIQFIVSRRQIHR